MSTITGVGIGRGIARGPVARMSEALPAPENTPSTLGADAERARAREAVAAVAAELQQRAETAGGSAAEVLDAQAMIAEDPTLEEETDARIDDGATAEWAVHDAFSGFQETLRSVGGYLGERAADLDDIAGRVLARLRGVSAPGVPDPGHPFVLVARDLAPADTALLDLDQVLALVTTDGGPTSHTAILAREKGIVAVVGAADAAGIAEGATVIVDAALGAVTTDPTDDELAAADARIAARAADDDAPPSPGVLADGTAVPLLANLGKPADADEAVARGAEGVGLFRTEFLFLSAETAPTVDEQREAYTQLLQAFGGKKVVVRMLDAGADKPLAFLNDSDEENPALGLRGLRSLRAAEAVLRDQLTALAAADAATEADLWVMAPMVATVEETAYFTALAREHGLKTTGVMIEIPAAALLADRVLAHADFASIGTNDLTQYTMAADRMLGSVASYQDPWHPAVLRLVAEVGTAGAALGKPVGICGEAAADPLLALVLVGLGATSLSMAPAALSDVRRALSERTLDETRQLAEAALAADDAAHARSAVAAATASLPSHQKETTS
ncbi:phosphoenolpyruvate--protein phosphotransferase [Microbacterium pseudoresistens]|uniref:Phosphoenolpyruvate-protein phosphotransferase n=1 Tax=Microbacterium pseudoresistens TaxID=640634 RepID=A0A7Y9JMY4_9MICO|nr:phosphoenolpyruvate--protein phosphotransferase [Microbacterium pseudoresistens]NYD54850.1 phosphotransferase system enzyme I (PtsI) [Microbacterium pseudoresistens]